MPNIKSEVRQDIPASVDGFYITVAVPMKKGTAEYYVQVTAVVGFDSLGNQVVKLSSSANSLALAEGGTDALRFIRGIARASDNLAKALARKRWPPRPSK